MSSIQLSSIQPSSIQLSAIAILLTSFAVGPLTPPASARSAQHPVGQDTQEEYSPEVKPGSDEGANAMARFELTEGFSVELFAAEPHLANPVCFCIDAMGRFYVAETFRHFAGVTDMREHMNWLHEDLASKTVEDRIEMIRSHEGEGFASYGLEHDRVRRIVDEDGDGVADSSTVFADGFRDPAAGIGAGLLARDNTVWFTCIPELWRLDDQDQDGRAESREVLHTGYGVNISLLGHDLHGLVLGPDGRLYFSIGDRGFHVETEGRTLAHPHTGAVLRCELDGSGLEIFATGLRNPQELVFDESGNLFTGDNNSDGGDRARWVWVMEGSDQGWRYAYQHITQPNLRGPWNAEKMWHPHHKGQPAFIVPPIANVASGPSGLTIYPGTGWDDSWRGTFFLCDFRGDPNYSGVHSFRVEPKGAGFELVDAEHFLWSSLVTDVDFGYDGCLYVSDWVDSWNKTGKGRIYRVRPDAGGEAQREREQVEQLFKEGFRQRERAELVSLLRHKDKRVRLEAQYLLAEVGVECLDDLHGVANDSAAGIARLHAIWGCAQIARLRGDADLALGPLCGLEGDADPEVRAQLCKALGEADLGPDARELAYGSLVAALKDEVQRVRVFAAQGLGKLGDARAAGPLFDMIRENADVDPWLRHAGVSALAWIEADSAIAARAGDPSVAVRRAALLVMRRSASTSLEGFLGDEDPELVAESARAIYDLPIESSYPALANIIESERALSETTWRRIVNACRHVGGERNAIRLASFSSRADLPIGVRVEALEILGEWGTPYPLDRITGEWHPVAERSSDFIGSLALGLSSSVVSERNGRFAEAWAELARTALDQSSQETRAGLAAASSRVLGDSDFGSKARRAALRLQAEGLPLWRMSLKRSLQDGDEGVRAEAFGLLDRLEDGEAIALLKVALTTSSERVVQGAVGALARIKNPEVDDLLAGALNGLAGQESPRAHTLELIEAVESRGGATLETALANYRSARPSGPESAKASSEALDAWARFAPSLRGGDVEAGRKVFFEKSETSCVRCHRVAGSDKQSTATGGEAGPELVTVGSRLTHSQILESILYPNASIAEGFENWILAIEDEGAVAGRIVEESDEVVVLETKDDGQHEYHPNDIEGRKRDLSGMPGDVSTHLSRREMRDLVAFLAAQKAP